MLFCKVPTQLGVDLSTSKKVKEHAPSLFLTKLNNGVINEL